MKYTILFFFFSLFAIGQTAQLTGVIYEGEQPTEFAEIRFVHTENNQHYTTYTQVQGSFTLTLPMGKYQFTVYQFNQEVYQKTLDIVQNTHLGKIILETNQRLDEVKIVAQQKVIERKIDRLIFNLDRTVVGTGGNVLEALKATPSVRVSPTGIQIVGKNQVLVLLDDRPTYLSGEELMRYLESMSSSDIQRIEVITTPPAKYEAEGNSGILNIVTKKNAIDAWNAVAGTTYQRSKRNTMRYNAGFNWNQKGWNLKANVNFGDARFLRQWNNDLYYLNETWESRSATAGRNDYYNLNFALSRQLTKNWEMGLKIAKNNYNFRGPTGGKTTRYANGELHSFITEDSKEQSKSDRLILSYFNEIKLDTLGKKITVDLDYINSDQPNFRQFTSATLDPQGLPMPNRFLQGGNDNQNDIENYVGKLDIDLPFSGINLQLGTKLSVSKTNNNLLIYNKLNQNKQQNQFDYKENNQAFYVSANKTWMDRLTAQVGLRLEATQTVGYASALDQTNRSKEVKLFPTVYVNYVANEAHSFGFNYSTRINRPNFESLNPTRSTYNEYSYHEGNPFLKPAYTTNFELIHTYKKLESKIFYSQLKDGIAQVSQIDAATKHYNYIWMNYITMDVLGLTASLYTKLTPWWTSSNEFTLTYSSATPVLANEVRVKGVAAYFSTSNDFTLNALQTLFLGVNYEHNFSGVSENFHTKNYANLSLALKYLLANKKVELSLQASNVLNSTYSTYKKTTEAKQEFNNNWDNRTLRFSVSYKFGNSSLKTKQRASANQEELNRM
ncbi:outer membrane beta-barrel family protein [Myroides fluvii]|uniref:outer membrane beta-barrel family protein n=1 Tax=Myroides fluvii TaxID=2572594 RepID=UPI00131D645D|nr:outer membrane beta-barrel family protein [Myroides fluvii]